MGYEKTISQFQVFYIIAIYRGIELLPLCLIIFRNVLWVFYFYLRPSLSLSVFSRLYLPHLFRFYISLYISLSLIMFHFPMATLQDIFWLYVEFMQSSCRCCYLIVYLIKVFYFWYYYSMQKKFVSFYIVFSIRVNQTQIKWRKTLIYSHYEDKYFSSLPCS